MKFHISLFIKIIILSFLALCQNIYADEFGIVIKVIDGDTVYLLNHNDKKLKVRLQHIDAPELNQPFGEESKMILERFILKKNIMLISQKKDKYKRLLGVISLDGLDINLEMIKIGAAWHYKKYAKFDQLSEQYLMYDENEQKAKSKELGLWRENAIPPWLWRKNKK